VRLQTNKEKPRPGLVSESPTGQAAIRATNGLTRHIKAVVAPRALGQVRHDKRQERM